MLTRAQVAKRIGRSIATVRRMEGKSLHPSVNAAGVHLFDASEVEDVADEVAETGRALDGEVSLGYGPASEAGGLRNSDDDAWAELRACREQLDEATETVERLRRELDRVVRAHARWKGEVEAACVAVVESMGSRASDLTLDALEDLVEKLAH